MPCCESLVLAVFKGPRKKKKKEGEKMGRKK